MSRQAGATKDQFDALVREFAAILTDWEDSGDSVRKVSERLVAVAISDAAVRKYFLEPSDKDA